MPILNLTEEDHLGVGSDQTIIEGGSQNAAIRDLDSTRSPLHSVIERARIGFCGRSFHSSVIQLLAHRSRMLVTDSGSGMTPSVELPEREAEPL